MDGDNKTGFTTPRLESKLNRSAAASSATFSPPNGPGTSLIAGNEGSHLAQWFAPGAGTKLSAQGYADALDGSVGSLSAPAVYVHLPFCSSRCLSCDRFSAVTNDAKTIETYLDNLDIEMAQHAERLGEGLTLAQLHLGGGTPNHLSEPQLLRLMDTVERYFRLDENTEMSLEASPNRISVAQLRLLRGLGFSSIKLQIRDLNPDVQLAIGRSNSEAVLVDVFRSARDAGIETLCVDLVYGLPGQTVASVDRTLDKLLDLAPDRLTCRSFTRRPVDFAHHNAISAMGVPSLSDRLIVFNGIIDHMERADYQWVGLDAFMRKSDKFSIAQTQNRLHRNWIGYNLHGSETVLGFGSSAITEFGNAFARNHLAVEDWQAALGRGELPVRGGVALSKTEQAHRRAVNGLFCNLRLEGEEALQHFGGDHPGLEQLQQQGVLSLDKKGVAITPMGRIMLHHTCGHRAREYSWASGW